MLIQPGTHKVEFLSLGIVPVAHVVDSWRWASLGMLNDNGLVSDPHRHLSPRP